MLSQSIQCPGSVVFLAMFLSSKHTQDLALMNHTSEITMSKLTTAAAMIFIINNRFENVIPLLALSSARCWRPRAQ